MSTNPFRYCRPLRAGLPQAPRWRAARARLHSAARTLGCVLAAGLACAASAYAQASVSPSPGMWNLWRTDSSGTPRRPPDLTLCVDAAGSRDPALLMGEAPGDASCQMRNVRRVDARGLDATLTCPGGRVFKASVRFSSPAAFVTKMAPTAGPERGAPASFVHARREGECPQ
jgi:hypothetical protein